MQATTIASITTIRLVPEAFCCKVGSITAAQAICSAHGQETRCWRTIYSYGSSQMYFTILWRDGFQSETFKQDIAKKKPADWKKLHPSKKWNDCI